MNLLSLLRLFNVSPETEPLQGKLYWANFVEPFEQYEWKVYLKYVVIKVIYSGFSR